MCVLVSTCSRNGTTFSPPCCLGVNSMLTLTTHVFIILVDNSTVVYLHWNFAFHPSASVKDKMQTFRYLGILSIRKSSLVYVSDCHDHKFNNFFTKNLIKIENFPCTVSSELSSFFIGGLNFTTIRDNFDETIHLCFLFF